MKVSKQQTFDIVYRGLAGQGFRQAKGLSGGCVYRGAMGRKCAAGHIIPDSLYSKDMERGVVSPTYWDDLCSANTRIVSKVVESLGHDLDFVADLQRAHDGFIFPDEMVEELHSLAKEHNLTVPTI